MVIITILIFYLHRLRLWCIFYAQNWWYYETGRTKSVQKLEAQEVERKCTESLAQMKVKKKMYRISV
ncbi:MAG: hypothetical protein ACLTSC_00870, partial [Mediterraneibacter faecis]